MSNLAPVAHFAVIVVQRLCLHPTGRFSFWHPAERNQFDGHFPVDGPVAWRRIEFRAWGGYHGMLILVERVLRDRVRFKGTTVRIGSFVLTFLLIQFGWLLFRAGDLGIIAHSLKAQFAGSAVGGVAESVFLLAFVAIYSLPLWAHMLFQRFRSAEWAAEKVPAPVRAVLHPLAASAAFTGILVLRSQISADFIYFQF